MVEHRKDRMLSYQYYKGFLYYSFKKSMGVSFKGKADSRVATSIVCADALHLNLKHKLRSNSAPNNSTITNKLNNNISNKTNNIL